MARKAQRAGACDRRALAERFREQITRAASEAGARMRRCADMIKSRARRAVIDRIVKRPPEKKLIDAAKTAVRIAPNQIDVERFEIGRRMGFARHAVAAKITHLRA